MVIILFSTKKIMYFTRLTELCPKIFLSFQSFSKTSNYKLQTIKLSYLAKKKRANESNATQSLM